MNELALAPNNEEYMLVPIVHVLKHPEFFKEVTIFILIAEKYIRLNFAQDPFQDILNNLIMKGGVHVYIRANDFENLLLNYQNKMLHSGSADFDGVYSQELKFSENETMIMLSKTFIQNFGLSSDIAAILATSNKNVQAIISKSSAIGSLLESFRKNCTEEYFKIAFTNHICSLLLNQFTWRTPQILEKLMLASTLCDLSLTANDMAELKDYDLTKLSESARNHPLTVIDLLKDEENVISLETITIIKQHHERPDGSGFPAGLDHSRINQLSTIFIIAKRFADMICETEPANLNYVEKALKLKEEYMGGFFTKTCNALISEVSKIK